MNDLTKEDRWALDKFTNNLTHEDWEEISVGHIEQVWEACCIYKQKRIAELEAKIADIRDITENTVEINMGNFNDDDVSEQNNALIEIWHVLNESEGGTDESDN